MTEIEHGSATCKTSTYSLYCSPTGNSYFNPELMNSARGVGERSPRVKDRCPCFDSWHHIVPLPPTDLQSPSVSNRSGQWFSIIYMPMNDLLWGDSTCSQPKLNPRVQYSMQGAALVARRIAMVTPIVSGSTASLGPCSDTGPAGQELLEGLPFLPKKEAWCRE